MPEVKYVVASGTGAQASSPDGKDGADLTCADKNKRAEALGVAADYVVREATEEEVRKAQKG